MWPDGTTKTATVTLDVQPGITATIYPTTFPFGSPVTLTANVSVGATQVLNYNSENDNPGLQLLLWGYDEPERWLGPQPIDIGPDPIPLVQTSPTTWQVHIPNVTLVDGDWKMPVVATWPDGQTATAWVTFTVTWNQPHDIVTIIAQN